MLSTQDKSDVLSLALALVTDIETLVRQCHVLAKVLEDPGSGLRTQECEPTVQRLRRHMRLLFEHLGRSATVLQQSVEGGGDDLVRHCHAVAHGMDDVLGEVRRTIAEATRLLALSAERRRSAAQACDGLVRRLRQPLPG